MTAHQIVDILLETDFSQEEMGDLVSKSMYVFDWRMTRPSNDDNDISNGFGQWVCEFKILHMGVDGTIVCEVHRDHHPGRAKVTFTPSVLVPTERPEWMHTYSTRWRGCEINWSGIDQLKEKFENWIRGPITVALADGRMSKGRLVSLVTRFLKVLTWVPQTPLATPEEVAQIKQRFDYGHEKDENSYSRSGMFEDPRTEGRETDYDHLTSEDIRFWNMLADEYDAKNKRG